MSIVGDHPDVRAALGVAVDLNDDIGASYVKKEAERAGFVLDKAGARELVQEYRANGGRGTLLPKAAETEAEVEAEPRIPEPMTLGELRELPETEERWLVEGLIPHDANYLWAGDPKTFKTMLLLELSVALVTATPFLGRFAVPEPKRVGLVLMEDAKHRVRRRVERIAEGRGLTLRDLDGMFFWFRPPLRFSSAADMDELAGYVEPRGLDLVHVDSWTYVNTGKSNQSDDVAPQLSNYSGLRRARPGLTVGLTHHVRKPSNDSTGDRLTHLIRNSGHFGAWYDMGLVLARSDEHSPVRVRCEMRDLPPIDPFVFEVEDQHPASPETGSIFPTGWLRLTASDRSPAIIEREAQAERFVEDVRQYLENNRGCSKSELRRGITGDNALILAAFDLLCTRGDAHYVEPEKRGMAGRCELTPLTPAGTPLTARSETDPADPAVVPVGYSGGAGVSGGESQANGRQRGSEPEFTCLNNECTNEVGGPHARCSDCIKAEKAGTS